MRPWLLNSAGEYERKHGVRFIDKLGNGKDGDVLQTDRRTAVKFLKSRDLYIRELRAYRAWGLTGRDEINGHQIPGLRLNDDQHLAIEMTIVTRPYLLDFASAYDEREIEWLGFTEEIMAERMDNWAEVFGDRWLDVMVIRDVFFDATGLLLLDLSLNNVGFVEKIERL